MLPTTSVTGRSIVTYAGAASQRSAADRQRPRNQASRGSFTTSSGPPPVTAASSNCSSSQVCSRVRSRSTLASLPASNHAPGRASDTATLQRWSSSVWRSTTHCGSPNPFGLVSSATTSGWGTCMPSVCRAPDMVLVPLRPEPTTNTTRRRGGTTSAASGEGFVDPMSSVAGMPTPY